MASALVSASQLCQPDTIVGPENPGIGTRLHAGSTNIPQPPFRNVLRSAPSVSRIPRLNAQGRIALIPVISQKSTSAGYSSSP